MSSKGGCWQFRYLHILYFHFFCRSGRSASIEFTGIAINHFGSGSAGNGTKILPLPGPCTALVHICDPSSPMVRKRIFRRVTSLCASSIWPCFIFRIVKFYVLLIRTYWKPRIRRAALLVASYGRCIRFIYNSFISRLTRDWTEVTLRQRASFWQKD